MVITRAIPAGTGAATVYIPLPLACTVLNAWATVSADPGCESTVTLSSGATAVGTVVVANGTAAGTVTGYTQNATTGFTKFSKGGALKIAVDARTNSVGMDIVIQLDPFARTHA